MNVPAFHIPGIDTDKPTIQFFMDRFAENDMGRGDMRETICEQIRFLHVAQLLFYHGFSCKQV
jgi:hypothetical protein